mmetsp:Transcript_18822/g.31517  ORF Transcript_18822/g.31517 Transcript_18822/m.31517 type:complete len:204 (+) Transcript_18822:203-814(+)|eukprot:CAMPEP_0174953948 /NCGR_PEP_ID=MMETSP0004_2-20121128/152_1 /TAXON_ID=420556 /ORGANISM="Ochromonas sp., Strain CCMP1393" /LENGTH=203 /DNA_ID=CAMNT_0016201707 /DNA_START=201 /DNA_END=812 /DNA_ORIENTATION=-
MEENKDSAKPVTLPYFHRKLSEQDEKLIGDITPKQIDPSTAGSTTTPESTKVSSGSAWNTANTWEERDCTAWAITRIPTLFAEEQLLAVPANCAYTVTLRGASDTEGNAQIAHIRGTARFIYELSFELAFSVDGGATPYEGKVAVSDVISDQLDDMEFEIKWTTGKSPPGPELATIRKLVAGKELKLLIKTNMMTFEQDFRLL